MISHLQIVTLYVTDQDASLDFFVEKLGFEKRSDNPMGPDMRWVSVAPPGAATEIVLARGFGGWDEARIGSFTGMVFTADDIQQTYEALAGRGVRFTEVPTMQPWGMVQAQFVDPDGNGFVLHQRVS